MASESEQGATQETLRDRFSRASRAEQGEFEVALLVAETIDDDFDSEHARTMFSELIEPLLESSAEAIDAGQASMQPMDYYRVSDKRVLVCLNAPRLACNTAT